jgi:hypothetical protein
MRGRKLKQDVVVNLVFAVIKVVALMWAIRIAGMVFLPAILGLFLLARRLSSTGAHLFQLGMSQTLLRYVSMSVEDAGLKRSYVLLAVLVWLVLIAVFTPVFYGFRGPLANWFFPNTEGNEAVAFWTGMLLLTTVIHFVTHSILVAELRMVSANVIALMNISGFLLLALLWRGEDATPVGILQFQALAMAALSLGVVVAYLIELRGAPWLDRRIWGTVSRVFIYYGLPRGAITFLDMGTLSIGPWLLRTEVDEAGFLIIALTLVQAIQTAIKPVVEVASVVTARFVGRKDDDSIGEGVRLMLGTILYVTLLAMAVIIPWTDHLIRLWLTDVTVIEGVLPYLSILLWGILPFTIFQGLKGIIEMRWFQPLNFYTLLLGVGVQLVVYKLIETYSGATGAVSVSILAGFWTMGVLTLVWVRSYLPPVSYLGLGRLAIVAATLAVLNAWIASRAGLLGAALAVFLSGAMIVIVFLFLFFTPFVLSFLAFVWSRNIQE